MKKFIFMMVAAIAIMFTSCKQNPATPVEPTTPTDTTKTDTTVIITPTPYDLEDTVITTIDVNADTAIGYYIDSLGIFTITFHEAASGYTIVLAGNYADSTGYIGTFMVDSVYTKAGIIYASEGWTYDTDTATIDSISHLSVSYMYATDTLGYLSNIYYITAGTIDIFDNMITGVLYTYRGSTINVNCANITWSPMDIPSETRKR